MLGGQQLACSNSMWGREEGVGFARRGCRWGKKQVEGPGERLGEGDAGKAVMGSWLLGWVQRARLPRHQQLPARCHTLRYH